MKKIAFHCEECGDKLVVDSEHTGPAVCPHCECANDVPGLSGRQAQPSEPAAKKPASTSRHKASTLRKATTARQKTVTARHSMRRPAGRGMLVPLAAGGVLLAAVLGLALAFSGGGGEPAVVAELDEARVRQYVDGLAEQREAYRKTYEQQAELELAPDNAAGDPQGDRLKLAARIRELARAKFKGAATKQIDAAVDQALAAWDRELRGPGPTRRPPDEEPGKQLPPDRLPSTAELERYLDTLPAKREFLAACYHAVHFASEDARAWWEKERKHKRTFLKNEVRLRYKQIEWKRIESLVEAILDRWRMTGEKTEPPQKKEPGVKQSGPAAGDLRRQVHEFLGGQADLKREFQTLVRKYGAQLGPGTGQDAQSFHNRLMARLAGRFPGQDQTRLLTEARQKLTEWAREVRPR